MLMVNLHLETAVIQTPYGRRHHPAYSPNSQPPSPLSCTLWPSSSETLVSSTSVLIIGHCPHMCDPCGVSQCLRLCSQASFYSDCRLQMSKSLLSSHLVRLPTVSAQAPPPSAVLRPRHTTGCWFTESTVIPAGNCATVPCRIRMTLEAERRSYDRYAG